MPEENQRYLDLFLFICCDDQYRLYWTSESFGGAASKDSLFIFFKGLFLV